MKINLHDLLPASSGIARGVRAITLGAVVAVAGAFGFSFASPVAASTTPSAETTIVNRSEKKTKLVLQLSTLGMTKHRH